MHYIPHIIQDQLHDTVGMHIFGPPGFDQHIEGAGCENQTRNTARYDRCTIHFPLPYPDPEHDVLYVFAGRLPVTPRADHLTKVQSYG